MKDSPDEGLVVAQAAVALPSLELGPIQQETTAAAVAEDSGGDTGHPNHESVPSPRPFDCICDRGNLAKKHPGNIRFRTMVAEYLLTYQNARNKLAKGKIQQEIIEAFKDTGRFLREDKHTGRWYLMTNEDLRMKVGQVR